MTARGPKGRVLATHRPVLVVKYLIQLRITFHSIIGQTPGPVSSYIAVVLFGRSCLSVRSVHDHVSSIVHFLSRPQTGMNLLWGQNFAHLSALRSSAGLLAPPYRTVLTSASVGELIIFPSSWHFSFRVWSYRPCPHH